MIQFPASGLSRREQAKMERRQRIVAATRALLSENGIDAVSVTRIAKQANVSPATDYNLFGTKAAILSQVFALDLKHFEKLVYARPSVDPIDTIFIGVETAGMLFRQDPSFYRAFRGVRSTSSRSDPSGGSHESRTIFWRRIIEAAIAEGYLQPDTDAPLLAALFMQIAVGAISDWTSDNISVDQLEQKIGFGFAVALFAFAKPNSRERIHDLINDYVRASAELA